MHQLYIPPGFAHGFCVLSNYADFEYKCTDYYYPDDEGGIIWNDPELNIPWPVKSPVVSDKDSKYFDPKSKPENPRWDCVKVKYLYKSNKILSLPELKVLFNEDELLVVKKGNRLSILPVRNDIAKILLEKI